MHARARFLRGGAALCVALLGGCGPSSIPPASQYASVSGRVYDALSHRPVAGATVTINSVQSALSDAQGMYAISSVPSGPVDWFAGGGGAYAQASGTFSLLAGQQKYTLDIPLAHL